MPFLLHSTKNALRIVLCVSFFSLQPCAAYKQHPDGGILIDRMLCEHYIQMCLEVFLLPYTCWEGSIFQFSFLRFGLSFHFSKVIRFIYLFYITYVFILYWFYFSREKNPLLWIWACVLPIASEEGTIALRKI